MDIHFKDIELKKLLESGKSKTYKSLAGKPALLKKLVNTYTIISTSIDSLNELRFYKSVKLIKGEDGTIKIPVDSALKIFMVLLLQGDVVNFLPLQINENYE